MRTSTRWSFSTVTRLPWQLLYSISSYSVQGSIRILSYYNGMLVNLTVERQPETIIWPVIAVVYLVVLVVFLVIVAT